MALSTGTRLGRYEIRSPLGAGGMGEVYLAADTTLERTVALKILPHNFAFDEKNLSRFVQEAKAASGLSHPNIITIHEIGAEDAVHFIATEFIDGMTLRERLQSGPLKLSEALDIAAQVASALIAAHAAGIVHRDIKPENIMLRQDGFVKVLDFGLCKLTEAGGFDPKAPTLISSDPNVLMGTPAYMSPEQTRGLAVDGRTDLWSLGVVLYEMVTGQLPFSGGSISEVIVSILEYEPAPLARYARETPEALEWVVTKALRKDREERYQSAKELFADLRILKHRLDFAAELRRSAPLRVSGDLLPPFNGRPSAFDTLRETRAHTREFDAPQATSSFTSFFGKLRASRQSAALALMALVLVISGAGFGLYRSGLLPWGSGATPPAAQMRITKLTTTGRITRAAISPDGRLAVYVLNEAGKQSLWVRQVATTTNAQIVAPADFFYRGVTFSHDGDYVYYVVQEQNNPIQSLYQVSVLGGAPRRILTNIDSPVTFAPDNQRFAFVRRVRAQGEDYLMVANADGTGEQQLARRTGTSFYGLNGPAWSPDGRTIALAAGTTSGGRRMNVVAVSVADGAETAVAEEHWLDVGRVSWLPDGWGLVISATEQGTTLSQVWRVAYPGGGAQRITNDLSDYRDISLTADGSALTTVQFEGRVNAWTAPEGDSNRARQVTSGVGQYDGVRGIMWTHDGRLVYVSRASGSQDIWIMDADGANQRPLTDWAGRAEVYPAVSADGRYVVFSSTRAGNSNIWRIDLETGANPTQLTNGAGEEFPAISPDGQWVVYTVTSSSRFTIWKVPLEGGDPVQLTDKLSQWPVVSPDGKLVACWYRDEQTSPWRIALIPTAGGEPINIFDVPTNASFSIPPRWTPDGQAITYVGSGDGGANIWSQPVRGGQPRQLTNFTADGIFWFDWSRDNQLALARGAVTSDVILIRDFR